MVTGDEDDDCGDVDEGVGYDGDDRDHECDVDVGDGDGGGVVLALAVTVPMPMPMPTAMVLSSDAVVGRAPWRCSMLMCPCSLPRHTGIHALLRAPGTL